MSDRVSVRKDCDLFGKGYPNLVMRWIAACCDRCHAPQQPRRRVLDSGGTEGEGR